MQNSVIIPTRNAERWISQQRNMLPSQTVEADILVIDSGSTDRTVESVSAFGERVRLLQISRDNFDHGGTRDLLCRFNAESLGIELHDLTAYRIIICFGQVMLWGRRTAPKPLPEGAFRCVG